MTDNVECPRCQGRLLTLVAQGVVRLSTTTGEATIESCTTDADSFMSLTCDKCRLHLAVDPGDGRLRRADLFAGPDEPSPLPNEDWEERMKDNAAKMLGAVS